MGTDLEGWIIQRVFEVFAIDKEDQGKIAILGYFTDPKVAEAFKVQRADGEFCRMAKRLALVKVASKAGILIEDHHSFELMDEERVLEEVRAKALAKLTDAEHAVLSSA